MAFLDHEGGAEFPYSKKDIFNALRHAVAKLDGFEIDSADALSGRIVVRSGISLRTLGERIPISLSELGADRTRVSVASSPRLGPLAGVFDWGKNKGNIELILGQLSLELRHLHRPQHPAQRQPPQTHRHNEGVPSEASLADRLRMLKALADQGLITQADFESRKGEILREI